MADVLLGKGERQVFLLAHYANRHGLVAGATGTGKTVSLLVIAEALSRIGVPVFIADVKGDVAGLSMPGAVTPQLEERARDVGVTDFKPEAAPVVFWDLNGQAGHPIRTTISEMGPTLLSRVLELNDVQAGVALAMPATKSTASTHTSIFICHPPRGVPLNCSDYSARSFPIKPSFRTQSLTSI